MKGIGPTYNSPGVEKNIMYWWLGQVTDESHWKPNEVAENVNRDDHPGWGRRYRVRIFSRDASVKVVPDSELITAPVVVPVTSGTGHEGYGESVCLAQGSFVVGFYLDGVQGKEPIILGAIPNNSQTRLFGGDPQEGFVPRTGYKGLTGDKKVATKNIYIAPGSHPNKEDANTSPNTKNVSGEDKRDDGKDKSPRKKNIECEGGDGPVKGIQGHIQRALAMIQRIQKATTSFLGAASNIVSNIENIVNSVSTAVASLFKLIIGKMRGYVLRKINAGIKDLGQMLPPSLRQVFATGSGEATDTLACVFSKIMGTLFEMAKGLLNDIINNYVMAPMCAAEKMVGDMVGNILGEVTGAISGALGAIKGLLGAVGDIAGGIFSVLGLVQGLLNFLKCDSTPNCKYVDEWSFWDGSSEAQVVTEAIDKFVEDAANNIPGTIPPCNTDQLPCGPPSIQFTGGGGTGLAANPIISMTGKMMGLDFSSFGGGYSSSPGISIVDPCTGGGSAVKLLTTLDGITSSESWKQGDNVQVTSAVVTHPGAGYTGSPNGNTNISDKDQTIINDDNGTTVHDPGKPIRIPVIPYEPDNVPKVYLPSGQNVQIFDDDGNVIQEVTGQGSVVPITLPNGGNFTTPTPPNYDGPGGGRFDFTGTPPENPLINVHYTNNTPGVGNWNGFVNDPVRVNDKAIFDGNTWTIITGQTDTRPKSGGESVDIILDGVYIDNPGVNYEQGDEIIMEPSYGGKLCPVFNDIGQLIDVVICEPGGLFDDYPKIYIRSQTGINANILPIFRVRREDEDPDANARRMSGDRIITVDDCIGRLVVGYVNGQPYYGPWHYHNGRKMIGKNHTQRKHPYIYDTPEESLKDQYYVRRPNYRTQTSLTVEVDESPDEVSSPTPTPIPSPTPTPSPTPRPSPPPSSGSSGY